MKRRGERRRRGVLRSLVLADPYRKLVSIGLAIGLWYFLDSQISATGQIHLGLRDVEQDRPVFDAEPSRLQVQVPPVQWTVRGFENALTDERITSVTLDVRGPKHLIQRLHQDQPTFVASNPGEGDLEAQGGFEFSLAQIRSIPLDFQALLQEMTPSRVKVVLERNRRDSKVLSTELCQFEPPRDVEEQRILYPSAVFSVTEVTLHGPEKDLLALQNTSKLFNVQLEKNSDEQVTGVLILVDQFSHFNMEPPSAPRVTIPLQPEPDPFTLWIPVEIDDHALPEDRQGRYEAAEKTVQVTLLASGEVRRVLNAKVSPERQQAWATEFARLYVHLKPDFGIGAGDGLLPLQTAELVITDWGISRQDYALANRVTVTVREIE